MRDFDRGGNPRPVCRFIKPRACVADNLDSCRKKSVSVEAEQRGEDLWDVFGKLQSDVEECYEHVSSQDHLKHPTLSRSIL